MKRTRKPIRPAATTATSGGGGLPDPFEASHELATITHGPYAEQVPIAGMTIATIRRRFRVRYDLPRDGIALVDGREVDDDTVLGPGQLLTFVHRANAKGVAQPLVELDCADVVVTEPEGMRWRTSLSDVVAALEPRWFADCVWPDGVKLVRELRQGAIVVHQTPARVHSLQWIADDSPAEFGDGTAYRRVRLALPYVLIIAVFVVARGRLELSGHNECYFANAPLRSAKDPVYYPALLNVSKLPTPTGGRAQAWLCTQHLDRGFRSINRDGTRSRAALDELVGHLFEGGFNRSSEHSEGASWFGETVAAGVDSRLSDVDAWQRASATDPSFATDVEWLPAGPLAGVLERIARVHELHGSAPTQLDVARVASSARGRRSA